MNINAHIAHWRTGAEEDLEVAHILLAKGRYQHALFFTHLSVEKALKAHVVRATGEIPPKIHNLVRLHEIAGLSLDDEQVDVLNELNMYQIAGRYADIARPPIDQETAQSDFARASEVFQCLSRQLPK